MPQVRIGRRFDKDYRRLSKQDQQAATRALERFAVRPATPSLHLERIEGEFWSSRASRRLRIMPRQAGDPGDEQWVAVRTGTHEVYRRY
jgi:hypothetical protein